MQNVARLYGGVEGYEKISFVLDKFQCVFFNTDPMPRSFIILPQNQGFILGCTSQNKYVYIFSNQDLKIWNELTLNTWGYFVSSSPNISTYKIICFKGGILNKLFSPSSLLFEYSDREEIKATYQDDRLTYPLLNKRIEGSISIHSEPHERRTAENGDSISTGDINLEIIFDEEKEIKTFPEMYGYILSMCQFMAFRRNIRFESIAVEDYVEKFPQMIDSVAECYVCYEHTFDTEKRIQNCLTFNTLGKCVTNLLDSIVDNKPKRPRFNIGFIPEDDQTVTYITSMKIREICSALESELELSKVEVQQDETFAKLVNRLKSIVKGDRDGEHSLADPKAYDYILGSLNHLSGALSDRIEKCFFEYQPLMGEWISRKQIDEFVKYRNTITHGSFMPLDNSLAETAFILIELVYCCILKRIGMNDNSIMELFKWHITS